MIQLHSFISIITLLGFAAFCCFVCKHVFGLVKVPFIDELMHFRFKKK